MADAQNDVNNPQKQDSSPVNTAAKAAAAAVSAAKAAGKAASGNVVGAVMDIFKNPQLRRAVIGGLCGFWLVIALLIVGFGMAIFGTIQAALDGLISEYNARYYQEAIDSNGNYFWLSTVGVVKSAGGTIGWLCQQKGVSVEDVMREKFDEHTVDGEDRTNEQLGGTDLDGSDYSDTLDAMHDAEALVGGNGVLRKNLDLIKSRVMERGKQIEELCGAQYTAEAIGIGIGKGLQILFQEPLLFAGVDFNHSTIHIDTTAFELTDLQALKIYAAYSIQHEANINSANLWDLMDYCGWYFREPGQMIEHIESTDTTDLYTFVTNARFVDNIGDVVQTGDFLSAEIYNLPEPLIPAWSGTCAPQWYFEERNLLQEYSEAYTLAVARGETPATPKIPTLEDGSVDYSKFQRLAPTLTYSPTFGIIDKMYVNTEAKLTIGKVAYHGNWESLMEQGDHIFDQISSFTDSVLIDPWRYLFGWDGQSESPVKAKKDTQYCTVYRNEDNTHSAQFRVPDETATYVLATLDGDLLPATQEIETGESQRELRWDNLEPMTSYDVFLAEDSDSGTTYTKVDSFVTFESYVDTSHDAYQLRINLTLSFAPRSLDDLMYNVLGFWEGELSDYIISQEGWTDPISGRTYPATKYAKNHVGVKNMLYEWEDHYIDDNGQLQTFTFTRQNAHQDVAFIDNIKGLAQTFDIDTVGLQVPEYGYGDNMVAMAWKEYEYYTANNMVGGSRYWRMASDALGMGFDENAAWCVCFVMCCAYECGYIGDGLCFGGDEEPYGWVFWVGGLWNRLVGGNLADGYNAVNSYKPVPGDLVLFSPDVGSDQPDHVEIVVEVSDDGSIKTIGGNSHNKVRNNYYANYNIGSYAYTYQGYDVLISQYIHPYYPKTLPDSLYYESASVSPVIPALGAAFVANGDERILLAGIPRFRESQLADVVADLQNRYEQFDTAALQDALNANDFDAFMAAWNEIAAAKPEEFRQAQLEIHARQVIQPVMQHVDAGFSWTKTLVRQELLWSITTSSDDLDGVCSVLNTLCAGWGDELTDEELLAKLKANDFLANTLYECSSTLWAFESDTLRHAWIDSVCATLDVTISKHIH